MARVTRPWAAAAVILATLAGCAAPSAREPTPASAAPSDEALANATYASGLLEGTPVTLRDGLYERGDGIVVRLMPAPAARGVVAGRPSAAVLLAESGGGSGTFISLVLVQETDGRAVPVASTLLGDRPRVNRVEIEAGGVVLVDMLAVGEKDPACCASTPLVARYALEDGKLVLRSAQAGPR